MHVLHDRSSGDLSLDLGLGAGKANADTRSPRAGEYCEIMDDEGASNRAFLNAEELGADKALLQAAFRGDVAEAAALLDDHDANIAAKGLPGTSCAGCASIGGHVELLRFLQQRGAHLDTPDYGGATPLMEACRHGHVALAQYLRDQGAGMGVVDAQGWTLAHVAAARQQTDIVRMLVRWGATLDACDSDGKRPCDWTDNAEILQLLEEGVEERGEGGSSRTSDSGHKSTIKAKSLAPVVVCLDYLCSRSCPDCRSLSSLGQVSCPKQSCRPRLRRESSAAAAALPHRRQT